VVKGQVLRTLEAMEESGSIQGSHAKSTLRRQDTGPLPSSSSFSATTEKLSTTLSSLTFHRPLHQSDGAVDKTADHQNENSKAKGASIATSTLAPPLSSTSCISVVDIPSPIGKVEGEEEDTTCDIITSLTQRRIHQSGDDSLDAFSTGPILIILVTAGHRQQLSRNTAHILEQLCAIHIDIPIEVLQRHWHQSESPLYDFITLDPYLVDEMSKRRYSQLMLSDSITGCKEYWKSDIVLLRPERMMMEKVDSERDEVDFDTAPSPFSTPGAPSGLANASKDTLNVIATRVFAEAVQKLVNETEEGIGLLQKEERAASVKRADSDANTNGFHQELASLTKPTKALSLETQISPIRRESSRDGFSTSPSSKAVFSTSPEKIHYTTSDNNKLQLQASPSRNSPSSLERAPSPYIASNRQPRNGRPMLARLDTSEQVKHSINTQDPSMASRRGVASPASRNITLELKASPRKAKQRREVCLRVGDDDRRTLPITSPVSALSTLSSPSRSLSLASGLTASSSSFEPSEIIPDFLYLGSDIATSSEVDYLQKKLGIKRILNAAREIEDGGGDHLNLNRRELSGIEMYKKVPLTDSIEAKGVQDYIEDDARVHSAPVYVHCKAGQSRSVMLVIAYLIHHNQWSFQTSYSYVVERRHTVSPNIGFVAELMAFEERRLKTRRNTTPSLAKTRMEK
jgi:hypothetical protein